MSVFTPAEIAYLQGQSLGHLATVDAQGRPHVVPVRFRYDPERDAIVVGGRGFGTSKKYRDARRTAWVAFVVDDVPAPRHPRGVEVRGRAEASLDGQSVWPDADPEILRVAPSHVASWGVDGDPYRPAGRDV